jgi:hypothetical protein
MRERPISARVVVLIDPADWCVKPVTDLGFSEFAKVGPARYCSPRRTMSCYSRSEGSKCVSVTWRATSARPYAWSRMSSSAVSHISGSRGRAVQVAPIKPPLKAPRTQLLELQYDELLSSLAFKFNLRRYTAVTSTRAPCSTPAPSW